MKSRFFILTSTAVALLAVLIVACQPRVVPQSGRMVEISGDPGTVFMSFMDMSSEGNVAMPHNPPSRLLKYVSDYELIWLVPELEEDTIFYYMYFPEDGQKLDFRVVGGFLYVNDIVRSIMVNGNMASVKDWVDSATENDLLSLRLLLFEDLPEEDWAELGTIIKQILEVNPMVFCGDLVESGIEEWPSWKPLIMDDSWIDQECLSKFDLSELRLLCVSDIERVAEDWKQLDREATPKLSYFFTDSVLLSGEIDLAKLINFMSSLDDDAIADQFDPELVCSEFSALFEINGLSVEDPEEWNFIRWSNPDSIRRLSCPGDYADLTGTEKLINLEYLSTGTITDEDLKEIVTNHRKLVFLNIPTEKLTSLEPLSGLHDLEGIVLWKLADGVEYDFTPLSKLRNLRYVGLSEDLINDPEILAKVQAACPDCVIGKHAPFCLGAGWLVLMLPLMLLVLYLKQYQGNPN